jgi:hypothetical protein
LSETKSEASLAAVPDSLALNPGYARCIEQNEPCGLVSRPWIGVASSTLIDMAFHSLGESSVEAVNLVSRKYFYTSFVSGVAVSCIKRAAGYQFKTFIVAEWPTQSREGNSVKMRTLKDFVAVFIDS